MSENPDGSSIISFFSCKDCLEERPDGTSPAEFSDFSVGWTKQGFQVWCDRHKQNIIHVDFDGRQMHTIPDVTDAEDDNVH